MTEEKKDVGVKRERIKVPDFTQVPEDEFKILSVHEVSWIIVVVILLIICVIQYIKFLPK